MVLRFLSVRKISLNVALQLKNFQRKQCEIQRIEKRGEILLILILRTNPSVSDALVHLMCDVCFNDLNIEQTELSKLNNHLTLMHAQ